MIVLDSVQPNHLILIFKENQYFVYFGATKNFFEPPKLFLGSETSLWGVILLKLFDLGHSFGDIQGYINQKIVILKSITLKPLLRSKSFRSMTSPKVRFLRPNKVLGDQKSFFWAPQNTKNLFSQKGPIL